jgi:hypothetical protein
LPQGRVRAGHGAGGSGDQSADSSNSLCFLRFTGERDGEQAQAKRHHDRARCHPHIDISLDPDKLGVSSRGITPSRATIDLCGERWR